MSAETPGQAALPPMPPKWTRSFRKRPVVVQAVRLTRENASEVWGWVAPAVKAGQAVDVTIDIDKGLTVSTLEGDMRADYGWWVIKGVAGEFYPCKDAIFRETYEPACRVCDGSGKLTVPDGDGESASEQACPDPVHDRYPAPEDETPGYWYVRAALAAAVHALQLVKLGTDVKLAAMARETLAKVDETMQGKPAEGLAETSDVDVAAEFLRLRERLRMLLADTPFEFRPDWASEYIGDGE